MGKTCRCGWDGEGEHPCHRCHEKPGKRRFYPPTMRFSLSGQQFKLSVTETFGCDECWAEFMKKWKEQNGPLPLRQIEEEMPSLPRRIGRSKSPRLSLGWRRGGG